MKRKHEEEELTLESWRAECRELDAETERTSAEVRQMLEEVRADREIDPEVRSAMLEVGERILGMDGWVKEFQTQTDGLISQCDALIARAEALESKTKGKRVGVKGAKARRGGAK